MNEPNPDPPQTALGRLCRYANAVVVFLIVAWHLVFLAIRNPLDLWDKDIRAYLKKPFRQPAPDEKQVEGSTSGESPWDYVGPYYVLADRVTYRFANTTGCEQRWVMFTPPMARRAPFLAVRFEFADGSTVTNPSANEPADSASFFRFGGWQTRKLEDVLMEVPESREADPEWPMWVAFVRHQARLWKQKHPDDRRELRRIVLVKRRIYFPAPDEPIGHYAAPEETDLIKFDPDGRALP